MPDVLRSIDLSERVLMFLSLGPSKMGVLCVNVGISDTHSGHQQLYPILTALRAKGRIQKLGTRQTTHWALASYAGGLPMVPHHPPKAAKKLRSATEPVQSWWLVPSDQFTTAASQRFRKGFGNE